MELTALLDESTTISQLLEPIDGLAPCGEDVRLATRSQILYYDLKERCQHLRAQEEDGLPSGDEERKKPDWQPVIEQATALLTTHTKDIELCTWLTEALVRKQGFAGLALGLNLIADMIEKYAQEIYPLPDEEGNFTRLMPISALSGASASYPGTLISPLNLVPLLSVDDETISLWDIHQAEQKRKNPQKTDVTIDELRTLASRAPESAIAQCQQQLSDSALAMQRLDAVITEYYGANTPSISQLRSLVGNCEKALGRIIVAQDADEKKESATEKTSEAAPVAAADDSGKADKQKATTAIKTALAYYRTAEPHSPIGPLLERLLAWSTADFKHVFNEMLLLDAQEGHVAESLALRLFPSPRKKKVTQRERMESSMSMLDSVEEY